MSRIDNPESYPSLPYGMDFIMNLITTETTLSGHLHEYILNIERKNNDQEDYHLYRL